MTKQQFANFYATEKQILVEAIQKDPLRQKEVVQNREGKEDLWEKIVRAFNSNENTISRTTS